MFPACRKSSYVITGNDDLLPLSGACPGIDVPCHRDDFQTKIAVQLSDQLRIVIGQHAVHPLRRQTSENQIQPDVVYIDKTSFPDFAECLDTYRVSSPWCVSHILVFSALCGMILIPLQPLHPTNIIIVPADSQSAGTVRHSSNPLNIKRGCSKR